MVDVLYFAQSMIFDFLKEHSILAAPVVQVEFNSKRLEQKKNEAKFGYIKKHEYISLINLSINAKFSIKYSHQNYNRLFLVFNSFMRS